LPLAVIYAVLIFLFSAVPYLSAPRTKFQLVDKFYHLIEFGVFSFLLFLVFFKSNSNVFKKRPQLFSVIFGVAYALSDEIHQKFVPGRSADLFDFLADCAGVILVQVILWFYLRSRSL